MPPPAHPVQRKLFVIGSFVEAHCWFVDQLPGNDESQHASAYVRECAGKGLAVALGAHRLGADVDVLIAAGNDAAGDALVALLQREGMGTAHVHRLGLRSSQGCGLFSAQGESTVTVFPGANLLLGVRELQLAAPALRHAAVVYAQLEAPLPTVRAGLEVGRAQGAITVLNPSPWPADARSDRPAHGREDWAALLAASQVLVLNRAEAAAWLRELDGQAEADPGALSSSALTAIWAQWPSGQWLVITLADQGCVAYGQGGAHHREPGHALACSQPIGAGDAFSAGLCAALADGMPMPQALRAANACGALAASREGILGALPFKAEAQSLLATAG